MTIYDSLIAKAIGGSGGGGGGGDYSTVKVAFINNSSADSITIDVPNIYEEKLYTILTSADISGGDEQDVVLYKGEVSGFVSNESSPTTLSCTGDITVSGRSFIITGNGTITLTDG